MFNSRIMKTNTPVIMARADLSGALVDPDDATQHKEDLYTAVKEGHETSHEYVFPVPHLLFPKLFCNWFQFSDATQARASPLDL